MHWQLGGNLEPVQMICELDWKECPKAIANYIWNEIVTDVLDCLNNEGTIWRILAVLLACIMLLRMICSRTRGYIETTVDKEMLNKVGYKMEDLELKVNILTYKMQYGCWPLPHQVQKSDFRKHLRNLRLTMSSPNDRNNWIKHVLLSPRRNESYASYPKYDYLSTHRLTELFDAKKKTVVYPYLRQESLPIERNGKFSKCSSDKSLKLNSIFKRKANRKHREASKNERYEMQHRNATSLPLFSRNKNNKSASKLYKDSKRFKSRAMTGACKKFVKTMDECKRYLKELHDSNKHLGLVCASSNTSDESSNPPCWSEIQRQKFEKVNGPNETARTTNMEEIDSKRADTRQKTSEQCLELSNSICPVLNLSDRRIVPSKMNITFCTDMFNMDQKKSASNVLIPEPCDRTKFIKTSQEALYRVKRKLESLHNVLRTYEMQNIEKGELRESNNKINSICQNVMKTIVSATTEVDKWKEGKKNRVNFHIDTKKNSNEMQQIVCNASEHYDSDATAKSSMRSGQSYSATFDACPTNDSRCSFPNRGESKAYPSIVRNNIVYSSNGKYEKVPERVYYTISSDLNEREDIKEETTVRNHLDSLPDIYTDQNQEKSLGFPDRYPLPMETDDDLMITSPTSSHTEISKDSESEDKSTALLLQEALQFKKALLTRVELEKVCYIDRKKDDTNVQSVAECGKCSYINDNLPSKFLDIISEERSVSSSTDKTSQTYMFYNVKQDKELLPSSTFNNNMPDMSDSNACSKGYLDSKHNLSSPSEYFSFTNIIQEESGANDNQLTLQKRNIPTKMISGNVETKCSNDASKKSNVKLAQMNYVQYLNAPNTNMNEKKSCYEYMNEKVNLKKHSLDLNDRNELINQSIHSVELYSENLDESPLNEENENSNADITSNILNGKQNIIVSRDKSVDDGIVNAKINIENGEKYTENNGITTRVPNFNLKRHPGTCSLFEQVLEADIEKEVETNKMLENQNDVYQLSPTESKETSTETNLMQDSLTSTVDQSNDSIIPEPPSVTGLINKSLDEEKLNLNWLNANTEFSDDCVNETDIKTLSTGTIILRKYDTVDIKNYSKIEKTCNDQNSRLKDDKKNSFANVNKESSNNETDCYKSYSTLISPHSSLYFTDEASSSTIKLNSHSVSRENHLHSNLYVQKDNERELHSKNNDSKDINKNSEILLNEKKKMNVTTVRGNDEESSEQKLLNSDLSSSKSMNVTPDKMEPNLLIDSIEKLNADHKYVSPNTSPREISPRKINQYKAIKRTDVTVKSKSHENYTPKTEKLKVSGLRSDLLNSDQIKSESNKHLKRTRDLSAVPRRTIENNIKLDRKRSRSQTSFRTNESPKQVASRPRESPNNVNTINDTKSLENKVKLKDQLKCFSPTPNKTSSKSCIPILKGRLEATRRSDNETRPKSPLRGPLTMTMFWKDNLYNKNDSVMEEIQVEGKTESNQNHTDIMKSSNIVQNTAENIGNNVTQQQEQMVIYVNIFTNQDRNTTKIVDPNKFLGYIKNREVKIKRIMENQSEVKNEIHGVTADNENSTMHKIVTIVSSVINGNEFRDRTNPSTAKAQNESTKSDVLTGDQLKNLCFLSVEQREIDVTAKPSVVDTSTSIPNFEYVSEQSESVLSKFQICGIPRELNNEEYVTLLEILHQERNFVHLQELQNVCKKLVSEGSKSK